MDPNAPQGARNKKQGFGVVEAVGSSPVTPTSENRVNTPFQRNLERRISLSKSALGTIVGTILKNR